MTPLSSSTISWTNNPWTTRLIKTSLNKLLCTSYLQTHKSTCIISQTYFSWINWTPHLLRSLKISYLACDMIGHARHAPQHFGSFVVGVFSSRIRFAVGFFFVIPCINFLISHFKSWKSLVWWPCILWYLHHSPTIMLTICVLIVILCF